MISAPAPRVFLRAGPREITVCTPNELPDIIREGRTDQLATLNPLGLLTPGNQHMRSYVQTFPCEGRNPISPSTRADRAKTMSKS
ncbi:hypothetical protein BaRGS_00038184 [Batillaria attramentaria]|uniref:Uncharacterized protein n=1 Tax=Batillaria attramentaria TaxID=370345 RepID=A0ABD0J6I8_9CAEN